MTSITATQTPTETVIAAKRRYLEVVKSRFTPADVERIVPLLEADIAALEAQPLPVAYIVGEGVTARVSAQTASRDYTVTLTPGTYPLSAQVSPEGHLTALWAAIPAVSETRTESSVEWGGVALAHRTVAGGAETYHRRIDGYQIHGLTPQDERASMFLWA